jgi:uncharacterized protein (DUF427 family)
MTRPPTEDAIEYIRHLVGPPVERSARWVRVKIGGEFIANSRNALLLRQYGPGHLPTYYFPKKDVRRDLLQPVGEEAPEAPVAFWDIRIGNLKTEHAAWTYQHPPAPLAALQGYISFDWDRMGAWYEEDEEIFVHARDPYKRVDVLPSSRHVRVELDGRTIADSRRPTLLFETGLPTRYYLPPKDVHKEYIQPSDLVTCCPYKGQASYWSVKIGDKVHTNIVWGYPDPIPENPKIRGLVCFFNERVDLYVDGVFQPRPVTPWS